MLKKVLISSLFIIFIFVTLYINISCATPVVVTEQNLSDSFKNVIATKAGELGYNVSNVSISNNTITMMVNNSTYNLKYNLNNKPTFTLEFPIKKGMSYDDFLNETDKLVLPLLGYVAVADIQGINFEDIKSNVIGFYLQMELNSSFSVNGNPSYVVLEDNTENEGNNSKTIYKSEFGDKIIEYVNDAYKNKQTIADSNNTFSWTIEKSGETEENCKLISTISVNTDAIAQLNGNASNGNNAGTTNTPNGGTQTQASNSKQASASNNKNDKTMSSSTLPKTGADNKYIFILVSVIAITIVLGIKNNNYKDVK